MSLLVHRLFCLLFLLTCTSVLSAQDVFLGLEAFVGFRTRYEFRNLRLADHVVEAQVATQVALNNQLSVSPGFFVGDGSEGFQMSGAFCDLRYLARESTAIGLSQTWREFDRGPVRDGYEVGLFVEQDLPAEMRLRVAWYEDRASRGGFGEFQWEHRYQITKFQSLLTRVGLSYTNHYYGRDGFNDVSLRVTYRHRFDSRWALAPYIGASWTGQERGQDSYYLGLNLEFLF